MTRFYKIAFFLFVGLISSLLIVTEGLSQNLGIATTNTINPYDLKVDVKRAGDAFLIQVSYIVPINVCQALAFLTNYEDAKNIPGIVLKPDDNNEASLAGMKLLLFGGEMSPTSITLNGISIALRKSFSHCNKRLCSSSA